MKVEVSVLKEQRDMWNSPVEDTAEATEAVDVADVATAEAAADAAEAAADSAVAVAATDYDGGNWSEADRQRAGQLQAAYREAAAEAVATTRGRQPRLKTTLHHTDDCISHPRCAQTTTQPPPAR